MTFLRKSTDRKASAAMYIDIAGKIERDEARFTCCEIWGALQATGMQKEDAYKDISYVSYAELFSPNGHQVGLAWWLPEDMAFDDRQDWRVLALCFMAAMVEAGDA